MCAARHSFLLVSFSDEGSLSGQVKHSPLMASGPVRWWELRFSPIMSPSRVKERRVRQRKMMAHKASGGQGPGRFRAELRFHYC